MKTEIHVTSSLIRKKITLPDKEPREVDYFIVSWMLENEHSLSFWQRKYSEELQFLRGSITLGTPFLHIESSAIVCKGVLAQTCLRIASVMNTKPTVQSWYMSEVLSQIFSHSMFQKPKRHECCDYIQKEISGFLLPIDKHIETSLGFVPGQKQTTTINGGEYSVPEHSFR